MGRKLKKGLDYFPLYHDFFTNKKTQALRRAHSHVGILTYLNILCRVYDNGYYYRFDDFDELCMDIAEEIANEQLRRTATGVAETINYLVGRGILDEGLFKQGVISGVALQEQYVMSSYKAKRKIEMGVYCLLQKSEEAADVGGSIPKNEISSEEMPIYSEEMPISSEESTQREEKEEGKENVSFIHSIAREEDEEKEYIERKVAEVGFDEDDDVSADAYREELKSNLKQKFIKGELGQGVVFMSNEQFLDLTEMLSLDELEKYFAVIVKCEKGGKKFTRKSHYQAIIDMAKKDRKIKNRSQNMENINIVNALKDMYGAHDEIGLRDGTHEVFKRGAE